MGGWARLLGGLALGVGLVGACGPGPSDEASAPLGIDRDVPVGELTFADVFWPRVEWGPALPVVVMFHGTAGDRSKMEPLATAVAQRGAVVYLPSWPSIKETRDYPGDDDEPYRLQAEVAVCSIRFAQLDAADRGGDPDDITVLGHSGGAAVGGRASMVVDPPWTGIDCSGNAPTAVKRFIGTSGDYEGSYQFAWQCPDFYAPYDLRLLEPTNRALEVRLIHGLDDTSVDPLVASRFNDCLIGRGLDSQLVYTDTGHADLRDPTVPGGRFVVDQVTALIHGERSVFDGTGTPSSLVADVGSCDYSGPSTIAPGEVLQLELRNDSDALAWFVLVGLRTGESVSFEDVLADRTRPGAPRPAFVKFGGFQPVAAQSNERIVWVFVNGDRSWVLYCMPDPDPDHPMRQPTVLEWGGDTMQPAVMISSG